MSALISCADLCDPAAADHYVAVVEDRSLSGRDGALGLVKRGQDFVFASSLNDGRGGLVAMTNLDRHAQRLAQVFEGNEVYPARAQGARIKMLFPAHDNLLIRTADLNHVDPEEHTSELQSLRHL